MAGQEGYLKLHRRFFDHDLWKQKREFSSAEAWIDLLASARFETSPGTKIIGLKKYIWNRGQVLASVRFLAERWNWKSNGKVLRFLELLKSETMIVIETEQGQQVITICNYNRYNPVSDENGTETEHERNATGTPTEQVRNATGTAPERDRNETKKGEEGKEGKEGKKSEKGKEGEVKKRQGATAAATTFEIEKEIFWENKEFQRAWQDFVHMRTRIKEPLSPLSIKLAVMDLKRHSSNPKNSMREKYTEDVDYAIDMLDQSSDKNWQGVFPVKQWFHDRKKIQGPEKEDDYDTEFR